MPSSRPSASGRPPVRGSGSDRLCKGARPCLGLLWLSLAACSGTTRTDEVPSSFEAGAPVVAYVGGQPIPRSDLEELLLEVRGPEVLEELILSGLVEDRLALAGASVTPAEVEAERARLLAALGGAEDDAERLLADLRERRGLGPLRFDRLLRRNAGLRKLVERGVEVSDAAVRRAFDRSHGRRFRVRLLAAETPEEAVGLRNRVLAGEPFGEVAAEASIDASRTRGGLLDPVHPADPTFPPSIRRAAESLAPGELSEVIALRSGFGYAVVRLDAILPADGVTFEEREAAIRDRVRGDLERLRMEQLARTLREQADVVVLDPRLQPRPAASPPAARIGGGGGARP